MRTAPLALAIVAGLVLVGAVQAMEPYIVLIDWQQGAFVAGAPVGVSKLNFWRFPFATTQCHRELLLDLLYDPQEAGVDVDGVGEAALLYEFRAETRTEDGRIVLQSTRITTPGYGIPQGIVPGGGAYELHLFLRTGADVSWYARLRGHEIPSEPACYARFLVNEVELDPQGADAGAQWVELYNPGPDPLAPEGWVVSGAGGASVTLPPGPDVAAGGRLKVLFPADAVLGLEDEVVTTTSPLGQALDETPWITDTEDDGRTWQRTPDGEPNWEFREGTPDSSNGGG